MSGENKRLFGDREEKEEIQVKEEMLKRFEGKNVFMAKLMYRKLFQWTKEQKKEMKMLKNSLFNLILN